MSDDGPGLNLDHLESYLAESIDEQVTDTAVLADGLNKVIRVATSEDPAAYVVRVTVKGRDDEGFVEISTEHAILERLEPTDVPAPGAIHFCADESVLGAPFSVIEYVDGEGIDWGNSLPEGYRNERSREVLGIQLINAMGVLHSFDIEEFVDVCDSVPPQTQVERNVAQLEAATSITGHDPPDLWRVAEWLQSNAPNRSASALVHGDYKPDNVFFTWSDEPAIEAIVDWETTMLRDPRTELGYFLFYWREADDPSPALDGLETRHPDAVLTDIYERERTGFWPFTQQAGSPSRQELVQRWENVTGRVYDHDRFYRAFGAFMLATVWEGLYADSLERNEDDAGWEAHIEYIARLAKAIIDGDMPL